MKREKVVCLGDSLTYGYPYGPRQSWVYYAASRTGLNLINSGVNGNTMEDMAARFSREVLKRQPLAVIILGGTNDAYSGEVTIAQTIRYLEEMLGQALSNGIQTVIGIPPLVDDPPVAAKLRRICSAYRDIAQRMGLPVLDLATPFWDTSRGEPKGELYIDGVHPNRMGYQVMGETAVSFLLDHFPDWPCQGL